MKSILFVIPTLGGGGAEKVLVNLVNNLSREKYDVEILTLFNNSHNLQFLDKSIRVKTCFGRQFRGNRILFKLFSPKFLYKRLIGKRYDIVVSYLEGPGERIVSGCPYEDSKLVNWIHVEQHTIETASASYRNISEFKKCLNRFDYTLAVSKTVLADFQNIIELNHKSDVSYNTLEVDKILSLTKENSDLTLNEQTVNIFSIGRLTIAKGFDRLIKAVARLIEDGFDINLYILGEGELLEDLKILASELGITEKVNFLGFHSNPYKYLVQADLFVCSSRREGFSTAVSEALILEIPVVSTRCSGAEELLGEHDEYGIVTENSDEGVYAGIKQALSSPERLAYYKTKASERGKKFSTEETVRAVEEIFDSL